MKTINYKAFTRLLVATTAGTLLVVGLGIVAVELAFTNPHIHTIANANKISSFAVITVAGNIYNKGENRFLLKDASGAAELETCPVWFKKIEVRDGEHVVVSGEFSTKPSNIAGAKYYIVVHSIQRQGKPGIVLRKTVGKAPWANSDSIPGKNQ